MILSKVQNYLEVGNKLKVKNTILSGLRKHVESLRIHYVGQLVNSLLHDRLTAHFFPRIETQLVSYTFNCNDLPA